MATTHAKVLLIENDPLYAQVIEGMAVTDGGAFELEIAESLDRGLNRLSQGGIDLILLDLALPDSAGIDTFTEISRNFSTVPIIIFTATGGEETAREAIRAGAQDYLVKWQVNSHLLQRSMLYAIERKRAEIALRERESAIRRLADSVPVVIVLYDPQESRLVYGNEQAVRFFGRSIGETGVLNLQSLVHPDDVSRLNASFEDLLRAPDGSLSQREIRVKNDQGEWRWLDCRHIVYRRDADSRPREILCAAHDITERKKYKKTEERLREQADLLDHATDAIILLDLEEVITFWSRGAERLYGWTFDEVKDKHLYDVLYQETPAGFEEARQTLLREGKWRGELTQITKDGSEITVESRWTLIRDERDNPRSVFVINTDITEKKRLEAVVLRAQRLESIGALASGITHDLNNVLAPILMAVHSLQQKYTDDGSQRWLTVMSKSAERGRDLIERLLTFARGAEGQRAPLETANLIGDIGRILKEILPKNIQLQIQVHDNLWSVIGDTTQIHQVLMNLCINARDAMPQGGRLLIKARNRYLVEEEKRLVANPLQKQYIRITVADTGVGIPPEIIDRIFDPFFTTKEKGKGTGLGLSTVMSIVRGHGGFVNVLSKVGKGTEFKVYLPAQDAVAARSVAADRVDLSAGAAQVAFPAGKGELILVVDDEANVREMTSTTLEEHGYRVLSAKDGREAVEIYRQRGNEIQLVVTDMVMPNLDGPATIQALREINPDLKVIATSGARQSGKLIDAMQLGVKAFLTKPYAAERLLKVVAESLNGHPVKPKIEDRG
jgi:PAS domain S-box-containing protein